MDFQWWSRDQAAEDERTAEGESAELTIWDHMTTATGCSVGISRSRLGQINSTQGCETLWCWRICTVWCLKNSLWYFNFFNKPCDWDLTAQCWQHLHRLTRWMMTCLERPLHTYLYCWYPSWHYHNLHMNWTPGHIGFPPLKECKLLFKATALIPAGKLTKYPQI